MCMARVQRKHWPWSLGVTSHTTGIYMSRIQLGWPGWIKWMIKILILGVPFCFPQHDNGAEIVRCTSKSKDHDFARRSHDSSTIDLRILGQSQDIHLNCLAPLPPSNDARDFIKCRKNQNDGLAFILSSTKYKCTNLKERFILVIYLSNGNLTIYLQQLLIN